MLHIELAIYSGDSQKTLQYLGYMSAIFVKLINFNLKKWNWSWRLIRSYAQRPVVLKYCNCATARDFIYWNNAITRSMHCYNWILLEINIKSNYLIRLKVEKHKLRKCKTAVSLLSTFVTLALFFQLIMIQHNLIYSRSTHDMVTKCSKSESVDCRMILVEFANIFVLING